MRALSNAESLGLTLLLLLLIELGGLPASGVEPQQSAVRLGKSQVHATRIIAKFKGTSGLEVERQSRNLKGLTVWRQFHLLPGLVAFDTSGQPNSPAKLSAPGQPQSPRQALLEQIQALRDSGLFEYVQPSYVYTNALVPSDARFADNTLWGLRNTGANGGVSAADIGAVRAWDITTGSTNVIVAVLDTGIRYTHGELAAQMWRNPGEVEGNRQDDDGDGYIDNVFGVNTLDRSATPFDNNDHGTHVAGIIGAAANDGNPAVGVAWQVRLMACKFLGADGFGTTDDAIAGIEFAVANGAKIINASWAGGTFDRAMLDALTVARRQGALLIAAAGNDLNDNDATPVYPAAYHLDNLIAVAAMDRRDRLATFSNYGRTTVHLGAPGVQIYSCTTGSDDSYDTFSGTSMAAPYVSGVAALLLSKFPNASVAELRERLLSTAVQVPTLADKTVTGGRVNAFRALSAVPDGILELSIDPPPGSDLSARRPLPFHVTVTDLAGVTNATVRAKVPVLSTEVVFRNNGTGIDFKPLDEVYSAELTIPSTPGSFEIQLEVDAPGKERIAKSMFYYVAFPPLNDNFADALDLPPEGVLLQWTNRFGTMESSEPLHAGVPSVAASVWWNWTPAHSGSVFIDSTGSAIDTVLAVYTNATLRTLHEVVSADDSANHKQAFVGFLASAGVTYHIAVAGFSANSVGMVQLRIESGGGPDTNAPQVVITGPATGLVVTNANDSKLTVTGTARDIAPNMAGVKQVQIQVNREVAHTADGITNWSGTVLLQEGQNRIKVIATDYAGNSSPTRSITVTYQPLISPNDQVIDALELSGAGTTVSGNSTRASKELGEPAHAGNPGGKSIWWVFRPTEDGVLGLSTANSTFTTLLALYTSPNPRMSDLHLIASNQEATPNAGFSALKQPIKRDLVYYIAVDGLDGTSGEVQLSYSFTPSPVFVINISAESGGSVPGLSGFYLPGTHLLVRAAPDAFSLFDRWEGTVNSTENPLPVTVQSDLQLAARFVPIEFTEGFESGDFSKLPWQSSGWAVQTNLAQAGKFAAHSGATVDGGRTTLLLTEVFRGGIGRFGLRVSSEPTWDFLEFLVNGRRLNRWSGETGWTNFQFSVPAGTNTLEWRYSKDFLNTRAGLDGAVIDNLDLPLLIPVDGSTPARLTVRRFPSGAVQLTVLGQTNQGYILQASDNFSDWRSVATNTLTSGVFRWDLPSGNSAAREYYRAIVP